MEDNSTTNSTLVSSLFYSCFDDDVTGYELTPARWQTPDSESSLATGIVLLIYVMLGIPSCLLIIIGILWQKLYRHPTHILLMSLALNDLIMCVTYIPINIISAFAGEFIFGDNDLTRCHVCQTGVIFVIFVHFNVHVIGLLSLDRFLFIRFPLHYHRLVTVKTTIVAVLGTTIFSILISIPPLFKFGEIRFTHSISTCTLYLLGKTSLTKNIYYEVFSIVVTLSVVGVVLVVTNIWLICIVQKQLKKLYSTDKLSKKTNKDLAGEESQQNASVNKMKNKKQLQLVKVFGGILLVNLITWTPDVLNVAVLLALNNKYFTIPNGFFVSNYLFFLSQVFLHPLLQVYLIPDIRRLLGKVVCAKMRRRRREKILLKRTSSVFMREQEKRNCCSGCYDSCAAALLYQTVNLNSQANTTLSRLPSTSVSLKSPSKLIPT